ncbi:hypothetical protein FRC09_009931 [Ceratobasidium sp. 395]|nr:hypothetical protein FRC09_009931 [Ceratobasidium sp. 395]
MSSNSCETTHQFAAAHACQSQVHPQFSTLATQLPPEVLYIVADVSSFRGLTSLVRLNRRFHALFNKLLYRNITIHSTLQLSALSQSDNAARNLSSTRRMWITRPVFLESNWQDIRGELKPAECLCRVLEMTSSLRELSLDYLRSKSERYDSPAWDFEWLFRCEIRNRVVSDPSFLSHLTRLECPLAESMLRIVKGRPIESISHPRDSDPTVNQLLTHLHPLGASTTRLSVSTVITTESPALFRSSCHHAARVVKKAWNKGLVVKHLKVSVVGFRTEPLIPEWTNWSWAWIEVLAGGRGVKELESIHIALDPPLEENTLKEQERALKRAVELLPKLVYAVVGSSDVQWRRHVGQKPNLATRVPDWTPRPNCGGWRVRNWWLENSGLCVARMVVNKEDVPDLLARLRNLMLTRWDTGAVPPIEWFHQKYDYSSIRLLQLRTTVKTW